VAADLVTAAALGRRWVTAIGWKRLHLSADPRVWPAGQRGVCGLDFAGAFERRPIPATTPCKPCLREAVRLGIRVPVLLSARRLVLIGCWAGLVHVVSISGPVSPATCVLCGAQWCELPRGLW
jgi:hypothetical protein